MIDKIADQFFKIHIVFKNKNDSFLLPLDSEIFQLKMMICSKLKIYEFSKLIILYNGIVISNLHEKTEVLNIFSSNDKEITLLISLDNNHLNNEEQTINNNIDDIAENQTNLIENVCQKPNNKKSKDGNNVQFLINNNFCNSNINVNNISNGNFNQDFSNVNSDFINNNSYLIQNNSSSQSEIRDNLYYILCSCNNKNIAVNVCFACGILICDVCKKQDIHIPHKGDIIRVSKSLEYIKTFAKNYAIKLKKNIINEKSYLDTQFFGDFYLKNLNKIETNFSSLKESILDIKNTQINYLDKIKEKLNLKENFSEANIQLNELLEEIENFKENNKEIENHFEKRQKVNQGVQRLEQKMDFLKKTLYFYLKLYKEIKSYNKTLNKGIREMQFHTQTKFNENFVNNKLSNFIKSISCFLSLNFSFFHKFICF